MSDSSNDPRPVVRQVAGEDWPAVTFEELTFSDGSKIHLDEKDIVVFVGPNNAGKSLALRELHEHIGPIRTLSVIKQVVIRKYGTAEQLKDMLEVHARKLGENSNPEYRGMGYSINVRSVEGYWVVIWNLYEICSACVFLQREEYWIVMLLQRYRYSNRPHRIRFTCFTWMIE